VVAYAKEVEVQTAAADYDGAIHTVGLMIGMSEAAAAADPRNVLPRRDVAGSVAMLGSLLRSSGKIDAAHSQYRRALSIYEELASADKNNGRFRGELAMSLELLARAEADLGDAASRAHAAQALRIRVDLAARDRSSSPKQRDLSLAYRLSADIAAEFGRRAEALHAYAKALAIHQELASSQPGNHAIRSELARIQASAAKLDAIRAAALSAAAIAAYEGLADTASAQVLTEYATALLTAKPGRFRDSRKALTIAERAASLTRWSIPETLSAVALARAACGDTAGAAEVRDKALALLRPSGAPCGRVLRLQLNRIRRGGVQAIE
jgi:tetratricopeptide (TPR) repeat protein